MRNTRASLIRFVSVFITMVFVGACSNMPREAATNVAVKEGKKVLVDQYLIGIDDLVEVNVWKHEDLSVTVPVRPDGKISVPLVGEVLAGGRTPVDVANEIQNKLSKFIKQPNVSVILVELRSHEYLSRVRVTGAVRSPLSITYRQGMTVLDIVLEAGGLNEFASPANAKLFRRINGELRAIDIELDHIFEDGDMSTNLEIVPGDILSVPERTF